MNDDIVQLVADLSPYVTGAVAAYGSAVLSRIEDDAADASVAWGRRILQRIFGTADPDAAPDPIRELAEDPNSADLQAALRVTILRSLREDADLAEEIRRMARDARSETNAGRDAFNITATASGQAQQAVQGKGTQENTFRRNP
ncbi:hypothetical protein J5X84_03530 [Streptosporangiaceae bacterium NEAU-GS5]|nr:hypothetical protein [Streptosporangiaceae bacterium NEAU-GS5]